MGNRRGIPYSDKGKFYSHLSAARNVNISEYAWKSKGLRLNLNHWVPRSSPGAPTKPFKDLAVQGPIPTNYRPPFRQTGWFCSLRAAFLAAGYQLLAGAHGVCNWR